MALYIGLMSGTSMDGIDAALVRFDEAGKASVEATHSEPLPADLYHDLLQLSQNQGRPDDLGRCDRYVGEIFATASLNLLKTCPWIDSTEVHAIGSHGQTVRHQPEGAHPFTLQLGDANVIAERTGIDTVADFRRRDMAAGGQGAPLVPAFHHAIFSNRTEHRVLVNIGGIANITWLPAGGSAADGGFDTGPGNGLMDAWHQRYQKGSFDRDGDWAQGGQVSVSLLETLLAEPYFQLPAPKSTGKELFNLAWLESRIEKFRNTGPRDIQRTLLELTVVSLARQLPATRPLALYVCGGGARNVALMKRLTEYLDGPNVSVDITDSLGIAAEWVEAAAFAWLARQTINGEPGNVPAVTGARGPRILGAVYPA